LPAQTDTRNVHPVHAGVLLAQPDELETNISNTFSLDSSTIWFLKTEIVLQFSENKNVFASLSCGLQAMRIELDINAEKTWNRREKYSATLGRNAPVRLILPVVPTYVKSTRWMLSSA